MQIYLRVISASGNDAGDALRDVVADLPAAIPGTREYAPMKAHHKGGYCLFLESPDGSLPTVVHYLTSHGWRPCL